MSGPWKVVQNLAEIARDPTQTDQWYVWNPETGAREKIGPRSEAVAEAERRNRESGS